MLAHPTDELDRVISVVHLYRLLLGRTADRAGLLRHAELLADGETLGQVARSLLDSPEGRSRWHGCPERETARQVWRLAARPDADDAEAPLPLPEAAQFAAAWAQTPELGDFVAALVRSDRVRAVPVLEQLFPGGVDLLADDVYPAWGYRLWAVEAERVLCAIAERLFPLLRLGAPTIGLVLELSPGVAAAELEATIDSLRRQIYGRWRLLLRGPLPDGIALRGDPRIRNVPASCTEMPAGRWVGWLRPGDTLSRAALALFGYAVRRRPRLLVAYCDEDCRDGGDRLTGPVFKPAWDPDAAEDFDLAGGLTLFRADRLRTTGADRPGMAAQERLRRATAAVAAARIAHLPAVLCHRLRIPTGAGAATPPHERTMPVPPTVSVVIATRDRAALLARCIATLRGCTDYPAPEIVLVDNGSTEPAALALLQRLEAQGCRVLRRPGPFNWSALNNDGVRASAGEIVVLMNNDVACIEPGWLAEMVSACRRPGAGIVGARLLFEDRTVQHAGVLVGPGPLAAHALGVGVPDAAAVQGFAAVTGACMAFTRAVFDRLGGLDADALPVTWNDIDFCLRARALGLRVLLARRAVLLHAERGTRSADSAPENQPQLARTCAVIAARHRRALRSDPFLNPQLSASSGGRLLDPAALDRLWPMLRAGGR